jgi:alpha-glucosidase
MQMLNQASSFMEIIRQIKLRLKFVRLKRFVLALYYSFVRDWWDRKYPAPEVSEPWQQPVKLLATEATSRGAYFRFEKAELEICFLTPDLVRINWQPGKPPIPYSIACQDWSEVEITLDTTEEATIISSSALKAILKPDGSLEFESADGKKLRQELPPQRQGEVWRHLGELRSPEHIYGLGERAAPLNLRSQPGKAYRMWNYDAGGIYSWGTDPLYLCIPVYMGMHSDGSYLIFYENSFSATFTFDEELATADFEGGALRYYLTVGKPDQLLERYTQLTGRPPLPPRWALGYHQSRWGYENEETVRAVAQGFLDRNLPLSAIHLDIDCQDGFRAFTIDPDRFPKLADFDRELAARGVRLIAIINPGVESNRNNILYEEGLIQEVFCTLPNGKPIVAPVWPGMCAFPDFTNPLARHWWSRQYEYLLDVGITGFWHDMNEPGVFTHWGDATLPLRATQHYMEGKGGNHLEAHNLFGLLQARAGYEALQDYLPHKRPFIVSRSGWAGLQRYAWTWTGDVETSWDALRLTIATTLGMTLSGIYYTGPDIGGFKGDPSPELYVRWFQMATFMPFYRTHSANNAKPRTPWSYDQPILQIARQYLRLRYQLMPYLYTLAWDATQKGSPPIRPLFWCDPDDQRLWGVEDAFCLGDALLIYPVGKEEARSRLAVLPQGTWYDFWNDSVIEGGREVELKAPLTQIPLMVKSGSILPMEVKEQLILHIYPSAGESTQTYIYSDAGDGYEQGRLDRFFLERNSDGLKLTWQPEGDYPFPYKKIQLRFHGFKPQQAWIDGLEVACRGRKLKCDRFQLIHLHGIFIF